MERTLTYHIRETEAGLRIEQFLRRKGYSAQNLTQIRQMPETPTTLKSLVQPKNTSLIFNIALLT